jgi:hypothetical protein
MSNYQFLCLGDEAELLEWYKYFSIIICSNIHPASQTVQTSIICDKTYFCLQMSATVVLCYLVCIHFHAVSGFPTLLGVYPSPRYETVGLAVSSWHLLFALCSFPLLSLSTSPLCHYWCPPILLYVTLRCLLVSSNTVWDWERKICSGIRFCSYCLILLP